MGILNSEQLRIAIIIFVSVGSGLIFLAFILFLIIKSISAKKKNRLQDTLRKK